MATTKLWDWIEAVDNNDLSVTQLHKLYTKWYIITLFAILLPIMVSAFLNVMGWNGGIIVILAIATLTQVWLLLNPVLAAVRAAGYLESTPGKAARFVSTKVYHAILYLILGSPIAHLLLIPFPISGHGREVLAALVMVPLVVIGTVWLSSGTWVIRKFWHLYIAILVGCVGYWGLTAFFPDLQGSEASSRVHETHQSVREQNNRYLASEVERVQKLINSMEPSLELEERVARLSPQDRAFWEKGAQSSFTSRTAEASLPAIKETGKTLSESLSTAKAEVLKVWHGEERVFSIVLSAEKPWEAVPVCSLPIGDYKISVRDTVGALVHKSGSSISEGEFFLSNSNTDPSKQFGLTVNGQSIGKSVAITQEGQCLSVKAWFHPNILRMFQSGALELSNAPSTTLVLTR